MGIHRPSDVLHDNMIRCKKFATCATAEVPFKTWDWSDCDQGPVADSWQGHTTRARIHSTSASWMWTILTISSRARGQKELQMHVVVSLGVVKCGAKWSGMIKHGMHLLRIDTFQRVRIDSLNSASLAHKSTNSSQLNRSQVGHRSVTFHQLHSCPFPKLQLLQLTSLVPPCDSMWHESICSAKGHPTFQKLAKVFAAFWKILYWKILNLIIRLIPHGPFGRGLSLPTATSLRMYGGTYSITSWMKRTGSRKIRKQRMRRRSDKAFSFGLEISSASFSVWLQTL